MDIRTQIRLKVDNFTAGYIDCALWASMVYDENGVDTEPMNRNHTPLDIASESIESMKSDCADFQTAQLAYLSEAYTNDRYNRELAGHDFWLTRNHHGAGYWDRGLGPVGDILSKAAHVYGSSDLYIGDDRKVYVQ
jgi:hypothetical protein